MVNSQIIREIVEELKLDRQTDIIPNPIPVIEVGLKLTKSGFTTSLIQTTSGTMTISAANIGSVKTDFYITGLNIQMIKDATCDIADGQLSIVAQLADQGGAAGIFLSYIPVLTLTAQNQNYAINFTHPIKLLRNSTITCSGTFTAGKMIRAIQISGYKDEVL